MKLFIYILEKVNTMIEKRADECINRSDSEKELIQESSTREHGNEMFVYEEFLSKRG